MVSGFFSQKQECTGNKCCYYNYYYNCAYKSVNLKYVWNVYCVVINYMQDLHTTGNKLFFRSTVLPHASSLIARSANWKDRQRNSTCMVQSKQLAQLLLFLPKYNFTFLLFSEGIYAFDIWGTTCNEELVMRAIIFTCEKTEC